MKLNDTHIAYRFITDDRFWWEIIETMHPESEVKNLLSMFQKDQDITTHQPAVKISSMYIFLSNRHNKNYFITSTVIDKLDMLKVSRKEIDGEMEYDWRVFSHLSNRKVTFIMPNNTVLRMEIADTSRGRGLFFCYLHFNLLATSRILGTANWTFFYVNLNDGTIDKDAPRMDVMEFDTLIYKLLCFMYLSENEEMVINAGGKAGTRKSGKIINQLPFPITVVTSKWNITSVRTEGFLVSPHFAIRWTGIGRSIPKMVFIDQFEKHGYVRRAAKEQGGLV